MTTQARQRAALTISALLLFFFSAADAIAQAKVNLTGTWVFEVQTDAGTGTPTVTFKQDGEKLTGHYSSAVLGEADLTGTVKGQDVSFAFDADLMGQAVRVVYTAKIEGNNSLKGTIDIGGAATGTFTGKRK